MPSLRLTGTAGVSPASSNAFTQRTVEPGNSAMWHSTKEGETPAVPVSYLIFTGGV